ncbi:hypothetical protein QA601_08520 [Chitinispirillales bacterium ANBcel5]|uniref:anti-sigma factor family protein n=1 Tax=Cellulosispirillum alkaliphilum TaxID=3039283 RepID=UPI002A54AD17|nr:hypothetical protein [Chitinispirillales bacterium ANBcel5]
MVCSKWECSGLLYSSGELNEQETKEYEAHLEGCQECRDELATYRKEQKMFYTLDTLGESPSQAVSEEILRVCSSAKKQYTNVGFFPVFMKKAAVSMLLLMIGFATVGYIKLNHDQAQAMRAQLVGDEETKDSNAVTQSAESATSVVFSENDSGALFDSLNKDTNVNFSRTRGDLNTQGVVPVDLKD